MTLSKENQVSQQLAIPTREAFGEFHEPVLRVMAQTFLERPNTLDRLRLHPGSLGMQGIHFGTGLKTPSELPLNQLLYQAKYWDAPEGGDVTASVEPGSVFALCGTPLVDASNTITVVSQNQNGDPTYFLVGEAEPALADVLQAAAGRPFGMLLEVEDKAWATDRNNNVFYAKLVPFAVIGGTNLSDQELERTPSGTKVGIAGKVIVERGEQSLIGKDSNGKIFISPLPHALVYGDGKEVTLGDMINGTGVVDKKSGLLGTRSRIVYPDVVYPGIRDDATPPYQKRKRGLVVDYLQEYLAVLSHLDPTNGESNRKARQQFAHLWIKAQGLVDPEQKERALQQLTESMFRFTPEERPLVYPESLQKDVAIFSSRTNFILEEHTTDEFLSRSQAVFYEAPIDAYELRDATFNLVENLLEPDAVVSVLYWGAIGSTQALTDSRTPPYEHDQHQQELSKIINGISRSNTLGAVSASFDIARVVMDHLPNRVAEGLSESAIASMYQTAVNNNGDVEALVMPSYGTSADDPLLELQRKRDLLTRWQTRFIPPGESQRRIDFLINCVDAKRRQIKNQQ